MPNHVSGIAPFVSATLTKAQIDAIKGRDEVLRIFPDTKNELQMETMLPVVYAPHVWPDYNGNGVKVAIVEKGRFASNPHLGTFTSRPGTYSVSAHKTAVAGLARSQHANHQGAAPGSGLYDACATSSDWSALQSAVDWAVDEQACNVLNNSWGSDSAGGWEAADVYLDYVSVFDRVTVVVSAGNYGSSTGYVASPATAYNVIAVGNVDPGGGRAFRIWTGGQDLCTGWGSSWRNPESGGEKPDISAPGTADARDTTWGSSPLQYLLTTSDPWYSGGGCPGTSFASPIVSGLCAQIMQSAGSPFLTEPEAVKAAIMVGGLHRNIEGDSRLSEYDGAGMATATSVYAGMAALSISSTSFDANQEYAVNVSVPLTAGIKKRIVLVYGHHPQTQSPLFPDPVNDYDRCDLDMRLYVNGSLVASSSYGLQNAFEIIDYTPSSSGYGQIRLRKWSWDTSISSLRVGLAWASLTALLQETKPVFESIALNGQSVDDGSVVHLAHTLGNDLVLEARVRNDGYKSPAYYNNITFSFLSLGQADDLNQVTLDYQSAGMSYGEYYGVGGPDGYYEYALVESTDTSDWTNGKVNTMRIRVRPEAYGVFGINVRANLSNQTSWVPVGWSDNPTTGSLDCTSKPAKRITVYLEPDTDGDGLRDVDDNCPSTYNPNQADSDGDGTGDACDTCTDTDHDGFGNPGYSANTCSVDNCPTTYNPNQADADADGVGDVCDTCTDTDHDGFGNPGYSANTCPVDNCPTTYNSNQADADGDGTGDACDTCTDTDHDGFGNPGYSANTCSVDNCPNAYNPDQGDLDGDGIANACDNCPNTISGVTVDAAGCPPLISWDFDRDGDVDQTDLDAFAICALGPAIPQTAPDCAKARLDADDDVDQDDFGIFQVCYSGEDNPADPYCDPRPGMVLIPAGEFQMGNSFDPSEGEPHELPRHAVYVDAFFMDRYEVTNGQYVDALNWANAHGGLITVINGWVYKYNSGTSYPYCEAMQTGYWNQITWNGSTFAGGVGDVPMTMVSWYGSVAYANWRSGMQGKPLCYDLSTWNCNFGNGYRLPTEAEWEKAARGGVTGHRFPWSDSDDIQHARANYYSIPDYSYDTSPTRGYCPLFGWSSPGGSFAQNAYGLYDMAGNVMEWCNDWYGSCYYSASLYNNPHGPTSSEDGGRVLRGGSFDSDASNARCAYRSGEVPDRFIRPDPRSDFYGFIGLRLVLDSP